MDKELIKQMKDLIAKAEDPETEPTNEPVEESKVSVDAVEAADKIADKIAAKIAESMNASTKADAESMRKHLFQPSNSDTKSTDIRRMKVMDFDLETVKEVSEKYKGQKVQLTNGREMSAEGVAKSLGFFKALLEKDTVALKGLVEGTNQLGGYLVPEEFRAEVVRELLQFGVMRNIARVFPMGTDTLDIPTLAARPYARWTAEDSVIATSSSEFGEVTLSPKTLTVRLAVSRQLAADSAINMVSLLTELFGESIAQAEDKAFFRGTGTGQPRGIGIETIKTVAYSGNLFNSVVDVIHKLQPRHRQAASFVASGKVIKELRRAKDTEGRPLWEPNVQTGFADRLYGYPIREQNDLAESELYFGDWRYYFIGDRESVGVETTTEGGTAWDRHRVEIKAFTRVDGRMALAAPFAKVTGI